MTDHATAAQNLLAKASVHSEGSEVKATMLAEAQVHATLALNDTLMWNQERNENMVGANIAAIEINTRRGVGR